MDPVGRSNLSPGITHVTGPYEAGGPLMAGDRGGVAGRRPEPGHQVSQSSVGSASVPESQSGKSLEASSQLGYCHHGPSDLGNRNLRGDGDSMDEEMDLRENGPSF